MSSEVSAGGGDAVTTMSGELGQSSVGLSVLLGRTCWKADRTVGLPGLARSSGSLVSVLGGGDGFLSRSRPG